VQKITPGEDWVNNAWKFLEEREKERPRFLYERQGQDIMLHWPPEEDALRRILNEKAPSTPDPSE
jgi:hypothetical protein